jgi:putative hydrolase of the HAD superfamily
MVLVFDLDDTLYDEITYVRSGFRAVAEHAEREHGWDADASFADMMRLLRRDGRGAVFDRWLEQREARTATAVRTCVRVYRNHTPSIELYPVAPRLLRALRRNHRLYVVTDGHKVAQSRKVEALAIETLVEKAYITSRHGLRHAKPSTYCFERIRELERCEWTDMAYVGDNPAKDFVNLNPLGVHTVRVLTGAHSDVEARPGHDARHTIPNLEYFEALLEALTR